MKKNELPYSAYRKEGNVVYISGQLPISPKTGDIVGEDIISQAKQSLDNIKKILESIGLEMESLVRVNIYLTDIDDISKINDVYVNYFSDILPSRVAVGVNSLAKGAKIEIDGISVIK